MSDRCFRFGVTAGFASTGQAWVEMARRAEGLGYASFLVPDTQATLSPFPALAAAATATSSLRVGTYVLSAPNRTPGAVAWESASLDTLSGGRFELGLGAGRPAARDDATRLGVPFGSPSERVRQLAHTIRAVKELRDRADGFSAVRPVQRPHPPILVAGRGARVMRLAAREADTIALGLPPHSPEEQLAVQVAGLRELAGARFDDIEMAIHVAAVADDLADLPGDGWLARQVGGDPRVMAALGGVAFLVGKPARVADALRRRRDTLGISYITVSGMFVEQLAPVVELLAGR